MKSPKTQARGRPRKFREECRPVTVTLPVRILDRLREINPDRALAIARAAENLVGQPDPLRVDILPATKTENVIHVGALKSLRHIPMIHLVPVMPGRFLIALEAGTTFEQLEIALLDLLENLRESEECERPALERLRQSMAGLRRASRMRKVEILLVQP